MSRLAATLRIFFAVGAPQAGGVELHVAQYRVDGVAALRLGGFVRAVGRELDIYRVGVGYIFLPTLLIFKEGGVVAVGS